ncbi:MAG: hypothetical protein AAGG75_25780 [Bacteroidota bacterium]
MKLKASVLFVILFFYSCGKCDKDIKIGEFNLSEPSRQFIPYSGTEVLVFEDNNGVQHQLTSLDGREIQNLRMNVRTLCDEGTFDKQEQYYDIQIEQVTFFDSSGTQIFYVNLVTQFEDADDLDSIAVYDFFYL